MHLACRAFQCARCVRAGFEVHTVVCAWAHTNARARSGWFLSSQEIGTLRSAAERACRGVAEDEDFEADTLRNEVAALEGEVRRLQVRPTDSEKPCACLGVHRPDDKSSIQHSGADSHLVCMAAK
jgi:hypothetical protein